MNYRKILLFVFVCSTLAYCKKKNDLDQDQDTDTPVLKNDTAYYLTTDSSLIRQFLFSAGTYWVYRDSTTSATDSIFCNGNHSKIAVITGGGGMGTPMQIAKYKYHENILQPDISRYHYYIQGDYVYLRAPIMGLGVNLFSIKNGQLTGDNLSTFLSSIVVNGVSYTNVYKFHFGNFETFKYGYCYMKPGMGIIKQELYTNEAVPKRLVYELVRYHIK